MVTLGMPKNGFAKDKISKTIAIMLKILNPLLENFSKRKNIHAPIREGTILEMIMGVTVSTLFSTRIESVMNPAARKMKNRIVLIKAATAAAFAPAMMICLKDSFVFILLF